MKQKEAKTKKEGRVKGKKRVTFLPIKVYALAVLQFLAAPALTFACIYIKDGFSRYACLCAGAAALTALFCVFVLLRDYPSMPYKNNLHMVRNTISYAAIFIIVLCSAYLPEFTVPLSSLCLIFMSLTSFRSGVAYSALFTLAAMAASGEGGWFFVYFFLSSLILIFMYSRDRDYERIVVPLILFALFRSSLFALFTFLPGVSLSPELLIAAVSGLIADLVIISIGIYRLRQDVVNRTNLRIAAVCDPEYVLLKELREESRDEFFRAVHTAYLCSICAKKTGADELLSKALGYYHRIGVLRGDNLNIPQKTLSIAQDNEFEPEILELIREYGALTNREMSRETSITILCDEVVSTIMQRFKSSNNINYDVIITETLEKYRADRYFNSSALSLKDLTDIEKCLKGEKLYYDFLR